MKVICRIVGHELIRKSDNPLCKVKFKGFGLDPFKAELQIAEQDRGDYPLGATAELDFDVQQVLPITGEHSKPKAVARQAN